MIPKLKNVNPEAEENVKKAELNCIVEMKTLIYKTSVDPSLLQLTNCVRNNRKERAPEELSPVFSKFTECFSLLLAGDKTVVPEELEKEVVDALRCGHPESTKMLAEGNIFWWAGMRKDKKKKLSKCTAHMSSAMKMKYLTPMTKNEQSTGIDRTGMKNTNRFSGELHKKHATGEPYNLIGIDRYSNWPCVRLCKNSEAGDSLVF